MTRVVFRAYRPSVRIRDLDVVLRHDRDIAFFEIRDVAVCASMAMTSERDERRLFRSPDHQRAP